MKHDEVAKIHFNHYKKKRISNLTFHDFLILEYLNKISQLLIIDNDMLNNSKFGSKNVFNSNEKVNSEYTRN